MEIPELRSRMRKKIIISSLYFLLAINILYVFSGVIFYPMRSMDTVGIWMLKAKAIYLENGFPLKILKSVDFSYSHQQYPLLVPFVFASIFKISGGINEIFALLLSPIIYCCIIILVYKTLRQISGQLTALVFTYFYSMFPPFIGQGGRGHAGNADIFLTLTGWLLTYLVIITKNKKIPLWLFAVIIAVSSQIKNEGIIFVLIILALNVGFKKKIIVCFFSLIPFLVWRLIILHFKIPTDIQFLVPSFFTIIDKLPKLFFGITKEMLNFRNWYLFWPLFFLSFFVSKKVDTPNRKLFLLILIFMSISYSAMLIFNNVSISVFTNSALDRLLLQLSPLYFVIFFDNIIPVTTNFGLNHLNNSFIVSLLNFRHDRCNVVVRGKQMDKTEIQNEALENLSSLPKYNRLLLNTFSKYLGDNILEVGSGTGNITEQLKSLKKNFICSDVDENYLKILKEKYNSRAVFFDITSGVIKKELREKFDAVIAINVFEHIKIPQNALKNFYDILSENGYLVLIVPAHNFLYSGFDKKIGHFTRYNKSSLSKLFENIGFRIIKMEYFNKLGTVGWLLNFKIFRRNSFSKFQLKVFEFFIPFLNFIDKIIPFDFGLSLVCIVQKI